MDAQKAKQKRQLRRRRHVRRKIVGTAERPRLSVHRSSKHIYAQLIDDLSGVTLAAAGSCGKDAKAKAAAASGPREVKPRPKDYKPRMKVHYEKVVRDAYASYAVGGIAAILDIFADNVVWKSAGTPASRIKPASRRAVET